MASASLDSSAIVLALEGWTRTRFRYVNEPAEILLTPAAAMAEIDRHGFFIGDCDDVTMFFGTLLTMVGIPIRFVAIVTEPGGTEFGHVFLEAYLEGQWELFDLTIAPAEPIVEYGRMVVDV